MAMNWNHNLKSGDIVEIWEIELAGCLAPTTLEQRRDDDVCLAV
jgi:hypothetical protein